MWRRVFLFLFFFYKELDDKCVWFLMSIYYSLITRPELTCLRISLSLSFPNPDLYFLCLNVTIPPNTSWLLMLLLSFFLSRRIVFLSRWESKVWKSWVVSPDSKIGPQVPSKVSGLASAFWDELSEHIFCSFNDSFVPLTLRARCVCQMMQTARMDNLSLRSWIQDKNPQIFNGIRRTQLFENTTPKGAV